MVALQLLQILRALGRRKFPSLPKDWPLFFAISRTKLRILDAKLSGGENSLKDRRHAEETYFQSPDSRGTGNFALCFLDPLDHVERTERKSSVVLLALLYAIFIKIIVDASLLE